MDLKTLAILLALSLFMFPATSFAADPSISTSETVVNVAVGTDDQTAATVVTTENVEEVKATRTLTVGSLPVDAETITIGTCTVTFATTTAGSPAEDANCTGGATILTTTGTEDDIARTVAEIATALRTLTNVSDDGHGALTVSGSGDDVIFTTTDTETSATAITFTDGTSGDITSTASTEGVVPVAQVNTITIGGTVDEDDVFTATLPTVGAVTYTVLSSDTTTSDIATGLNAAIQASAGYADQDFTSAASTDTVVLTAKVAGTGFTQTSSATNRAAVAQEVVFTPADLVKGWTLTITINNTNYSYVQKSSDSTQNVVEALQTLVDANTAVNCTEDNTAITCTAASAGTSFTYTTSVAAPPRSSSVTSAGVQVQNLINMGNCLLAQEVMEQYPGGTADLQQYYQQKCAAFPTPQPVVAPQMIPGIVRTLQFGTTGEDVSLVQRWLAQDASVYPEGLVTGYFGPLTLSAVQEFQVKYGIVGEGEPGYGVVGPRTRAKLLELYSGAPAATPQITAQLSPSTEQTLTPFTRGLSVGMFGEDVRLLQQFLNKNSETQVAATGEGSPGYETTYFGPLTEAAVQKFQVRHSIASEGVPGYGRVGPKTRAKLQEVI